jgi:hypothetical protein
MKESGQQQLATLLRWSVTRKRQSEPGKTQDVYEIGIYTSLELKLLWLLPCKVLVGEMAVLSGLEVDGLGKVEFLDDNTGS